MVCEGPAGVVAVERPDGGGVGGQRRDERGDAPGGEPAAVQVGEVDLVVAEQVGLDRVAVVG
jgi:hypothetical protein